MEIDKLQEILLCFSYREEDHKAAEQAFEIFYKEYSRLISFNLRRLLNNMGIVDDELLRIAMQNTFLEVYEHPFKFVFSEKISTDTSFKAWINMIAKNELYQLLKNYYDNNLSYTSEIKETFFEEEDQLPDSINMEILKNALMGLKERDREILMGIYLHHEEGKKTPSEVLDLLSKMYGTTKDNIRQIKSRCEKKIIEYFAKCSQLKPIKNIR